MIVRGSCVTVPEVESYESTANHWTRPFSISRRTRKPRADMLFALEKVEQVYYDRYKISIVQVVSTVSHIFARLVITQNPTKSHRAGAHLVGLARLQAHI
jgi:hypothetical protein